MIIQIIEKHVLKMLHKFEITKITAQGSFFLILLNIIFVLIVFYYKTKYKRKKNDNSSNLKRRNSPISTLRYNPHRYNICTQFIKINLNDIY